MSCGVEVKIENVIIPTYNVGSPEKNPMFLEKRVYQGSSGVVFPHPIIEKISDTKSDKEYTAVFIENEYIRIMILPELGGRIQMAYDKIKERHFIYYNSVIKPALVGLTGPWISGGIEFNWPQHHRPSTFDSVDFNIVENADGSKTVWVNEVERMFRTKGMAGITLYPGKAFIEIKGKLYNRTPFPQTFLWWANPAVKVNNHFQSVFPPDVYAVFDHGKRDVSSFPIAKGVYYKVDYSPGTDISMYKNIPVPTSYMAISSKYDFIGGYENDTQGGLLHVADHHIAPGKKQWTWGNGEFGLAWDKNLTDNDGPYIELMTGVYTDNQPDFSWLQPFEEKTFVQYFMPYSAVGMVKNATRDAALNIEFSGNIAEIKLYVTSLFDNLEVELTENGQKLYTECIAASPGLPYLKHLELKKHIDPLAVRINLTDLNSGKVIVTYKEEKAEGQVIPTAAESAKRPEDIENTEQLFLTGLHLEQYRHATYLATDYYEEALRRDGMDVRNNNALGLWFLKRGKFEKAEFHFRKAVKTLIQRNPNPADGEPYYNLGLALKMQGKNDEAFDSFFKCVWNDAWQHAGYLNLARIAALRRDFESALGFIEKSLIKNYNSHTARHLKTILLRKIGRTQEAFELIEDSILLDPFNYGSLFEKHLLLTHDNPEEAKQVKQQLKELCRDWVHNYIEYSFDYSHAGFYEEASSLLTLATESNNEPYPMTFYYLGWLAFQQKEEKKALDYFHIAASLKPDLCFSNRLEDVPVLEMAKELNPSDSKAPYYLGNFWFDKLQYTDAISNWERSTEINDKFPTVYRNLSLAYYNKLGETGKALSFMEKAFNLDTSDARVLMELDQLYKRFNTSPKERLSFLENYPDLVESRDDLYLERVSLYNLLGNYEVARDLIARHKFHPWEGGEGKVVRQYLFCHIGLAKIALISGEAKKSIELLEQAGIYPDTLGEGKLFNTPENDILFLKGLAYEHLNNNDKARELFLMSTKGTGEPVQAVFYNDPQPDKIYYQGMGWLKLGNKENATKIFNNLIDFGSKCTDSKIRIDYFAVSLPDLLVFDDNLNLRNNIHCLYLRGLGYLGLGGKNLVKADELFTEVLRLDVNHEGATVHKQMIQHRILL